MSNSSNRIKAYDTVHHLVSRIAHRVYFLKDTERNDFIEFARRAADFSGITLIGWCIMTNHFHLLAYLPSPVELTEEEILRRYAMIKGKTGEMALRNKFARWRLGGKSGEDSVQHELDRLRKRMYNIGEYMRILKQWFTVDYNRRNSHVGTLWEAVYHDNIVTNETTPISQVLAYIHLNPIRAGLTTEFGDYIWSSLTAFRKGDPVAEAGMRFVYGDDLSREEILAEHTELLQKILAKEQLRKAHEIARARAAGLDMPLDPITTEAMVVQAAAHAEKVRKELISMREELSTGNGGKTSGALIERQILELLNGHESLTVLEIAETLDIPRRTVSRYVQKLHQQGVATRSRRTWSLTPEGVSIAENGKGRVDNEDALARTV